VTPQETLTYHVTGAIERGEGIAVVGVPAPISNKQRFQDALTNAYIDLFANDPDYAYSSAHISPHALAHKMTEGLHKGSANKDGEGIKRACKACGIKQTYKAIQAYLNV